MYKWTQEDHELVNNLTEQGWTVKEIALETGFSEGSIKLSRRTQLAQPRAPGSELAQLRVEVAELREQVKLLTKELEPILRERAKARRDREDEIASSGGFIFRRAAAPKLEASNF